MDKDEANAVLEAEMDKFKSRTYDELAAIVNAEQVVRQVVGASGTAYNCITFVWWDSRKGGLVRVWGVIDDGTKRSFRRPLTQCLLLTPEGEWL